MQFKEGLCWKACYDEERDIYTAERSWRGFYQLCQIDKETYDRLDDALTGDDSPDALISKGRLLFEAGGDDIESAYCIVRDEKYNELAPWSRAKDRYERRYGKD